MKNPLRFALLITLIISGCASSEKQLELEHIRKQQIIAGRYMAGDIDRNQAEIMAKLTQAEYETKLGRPLNFGPRALESKASQGDKTFYEKGLEARRDLDEFNRGWNGLDEQNQAHDPNRPSLEDIFGQD